MAVEIPKRNRGVARHGMQGSDIAYDVHVRRKAATTLRNVAETLAEVPDGRRTAHTLRLLAYLLDPTDGR